jgi:hypothetical protein
MPTKESPTSRLRIVFGNRVGHQIVPRMALVVSENMVAQNLMVIIASQKLPFWALLDKAKCSWNSWAVTGLQGPQCEKCKSAGTTQLPNYVALL